MSETTASLKISVDSRDVKNAKKDLDNLSDSSSKVENSAKQTTSAFKGLGIALSGVAVGALAKEFIQTADAMNMLNARLRLVTSSLEEYKSQQTELLKISKASYSPLADTISLYTKLDPALKRLGASTAGVNEVVDSFSKGLKLGGASAQESSAAMLQFAQAMGSGVLRGDEFNSLMEASPKLMAYVAQGMGKPVTALREMAEAGKLTAGEVSAALLKMSDDIERDFKTLPKTVSGAITNIKTDLALMVDEINTASGVTENLAKMMSEVGGGIGEASEPLTALGVTISQTTLDIVDITKEVGSLLSAFNEISSDGAGISLFEAGLTGLRISLDTIYVGLHNSIVIAKELINAAADFSKFQKPTFLEDIQGQILTVDDLVKRYTKSLDDSTKSHTKNNAEKKKTVLDTKAEIEAILSKSAALTKETESKKLAEKAQKDAAKKAIKDEEDRVKKLHDIRQSQLEMIQDESNKKIKLEEDFSNTVIDLAQKNSEAKLEGLSKEALSTFNYYDELIAKFAEVAGAESALRTMQAEAIDVIIAKQKELDEQLDNKSAIDSLDEIYGRYAKLIDAQIELAENGMNIDFDFGDGAKELNNISKAMQQLHVGSLKYTKQDMKMQEDYAKAYLEAGDDTQKQAQLEADFDADNAKINETRQSAEIAGYANLAGAIGGAFEEGSGAAKAFQAIQATLGIVNAYTSISQAMALPYPANIPATAAAVAAAMPLIGTLSSLGGSGGGGGGGTPTTSTGFTFDQNREQIEGTYTPITDRLERQIELLESIDRQGSASQLGIELASTSFERDTKIWVEDVLEKARQGMANSAMSAAQTAAVDVQAQQATGLDIWKTSGSTIGYDEAVLREGANLIKTLIAMSEESLYTGTLYQAAALEAGYGWANMMTFVNIEIEKDINEYQNLVSEWALSVINSMEDLKDAASDFKGYYDDITGSMYYETARLNEAFADVDRLKGTASFADYLKTSIDDIKALESFFTEDVFNLLMSNDTADIEAQIAAVEELGRVTGQTFENGAKDALNYLESIELVAEAMAKSRENIESFIDSLKTSDQLAADMASTLGVGLATSVEGLASLFYTLSEDMDGLTDADLDLLNANKALLENTDEYQSQIDDLNVTLGDASKAIGTLDGALGTIESTIEKLRAASRTSEQSLQIYYDAIAEAQRLSTTDLYDDFAKAVSKASTATSALFETSNFTTSQDMQFAQLVAANQFEGLQDATLTEIDYLKQIEENTRDQILVLSEAMDNLGLSISQTLQELLAKYQTTAVATPTISSSITSAYSDILNRTPEEGGATYWQGQLDTGAIASNNITNAIAVAAIPELYQTLLGRDVEAAGLEHWTNQITSGAISPAQLDDLIRQSDEYKNLNSFAVGTPNVPYDMLANIHKGEAIIPETFANGIRNGSIMLGSQDALVRELQVNNNLLSGIISKQDTTISILLESRDIQNSSVEILERVEVII